MKELLLCAYDYDQYNNKASVSMLPMNFFKLQFTLEKFGSGCYRAKSRPAWTYPRRILYSHINTFFLNIGLYLKYQNVTFIFRKANLVCPFLCQIYEMFMFHLLLEITRSLQLSGH